MKLEVGKRYVLRNGYISGVMQLIDGEYPFYDGTLNWASNGSYRAVYGHSPYDIVSEYIEAQQPLRWVENCKPDKPGIWARKDYLKDVNIWHYTQKELDSGVLDSATRCYLGPIPEILPPVKKVVERLWVANAGGQFIEQWSEEGDFSNQYALTDWIRTDRTREREI